MSVRKYLPSAIAIAWTVITPAFAADQPVPWPSLPASFGAAPSPLPEEFAVPPASQTANWRGFYLGGQFSYSDANADFSRSTQAPIAYSLRETALENEFDPSNWPVLGTANHAATGFGGFVGYNFEYLSPNANIVMGVEANYDQASLSLFAPNSPIDRILPPDSLGNTNTVTITGSGTVSDLDFGTLRARVGWDLGNFLPYGFAGLALGRANVNIAETTSVKQCNSATPPVCSFFVFPGTAGQDGEWLYGLTVGAGLDFALTHNVFVRGEYEYVQFQPVAGTTIEVNTVRAGAGIKF